MEPSKDAIAEILERGVDQVLVYDHLENRMRNGERLRVKFGIDPTSPHIHIGRAVSLLKLRDFQMMGHTIVLVFGDFTGVVGDTSDKKSERPMLSQKEVEKNMETYLAQCSVLIDVSITEVRRNSEWLEALPYRSVVEQANIFSLAEFVARKNIHNRLEDGRRVSLREVLYPLMQGYDSVALKADVEVGGSDQWFNLLAGRTLQEHYGLEPQDVLTTDLISGLDGRKMSSSWGNTINILDEPKDMYGKVMSLTDNLIVPYFVHVTRVPIAEVMEMETNLQRGSQNPRDIKMRLAFEITKQFWGGDNAKEAEQYFIAVFQKKEVPKDIQIIIASRGEYVADVMWRSGLVSSRTEAIRLLQQGAISIDGNKTNDRYAHIEKSGVLRVGKKVLVHIEIQ